MNLKNKYLRFCLYCLALTSLLGCAFDGDWIINEKEKAGVPSKEAMPVMHFKKNIEATNYTALVYIKRAKVLKKPIWPLNYFSDYLNHMYEAEVIETYDGTEHKEILYSVMAEADTEPYLPNYPIVVSLCGSMDTGYYIPDNGYESAASDALINYGRAFKSSKKHNKKKECICK